MSSLTEYMLAEGYEYFVPRTEREQRVVFIDQQVASQSRCAVCGKHTHYEGFKKDGSYRAFVECNVCEYYEEL